LDAWQELDTEFFEQPRAKLTNKPSVLIPCSPRPHQENAVRDGLERFAKGKASRGKLIMPCGTGKSLTAWFLAQALGSKRIVITVPQPFPGQADPEGLEPGKRRQRYRRRLDLRL
jgi:predicted helicase